MDPFWTQVFWSFVVGGLYLALTLRVAERFGSRLGGMLLGLPSTALVSLFFIGTSQGTTVVANATTVMPLTVAASGVFLIVFSLRQKAGIFPAWLTALAAWLLFSLVAVFWKPSEILLPLAVSLPLFGFGFWFFAKVKDETLKTPRFSWSEFVLRAVFSGVVIAAAVIASKLLGPQWGGLMAAFPAAFSSTIFLVMNKHGAGFTGAMLKAMQKALLPLILFVVVVHVAVGPLGLIGGLFAGYLTAVLAAVLMDRLAPPKAT